MPQTQSNGSSSGTANTLKINHLMYISETLYDGARCASGAATSFPVLNAHGA